LARVGGIIVIAAIFATLGVSFYFYSFEVLTDVKVSTFGEPVKVGDIMFDIQYVANFDYLEKTKEFKLAEQAEIDRGLIEASNEKPNHTYFQIQVTAENKGNEIVRFTGGQLHLYDESNKRFSPTYVGYGDNELSLIDLEPQKAITLTTQFDIEYDEEELYRVGIVPNRHGMDGTQEIAFICIKNCS
tara:strand:- start:572 stop:1132 length:561 start_codon:yes stop_codon:yes gene_type:complete